MAVSFRCESEHEATVIRNAVNRYKWILKDQGIDPRNYAPPIEGSAGFGWDAVQRAAYDMSNGSRTYMSHRMASAIYAALLDRSRSGDEFAQTAKGTAVRLALLLQGCR